MKIKCLYLIFLLFYLTYNKYNSFSQEYNIYKEYNYAKTFKIKAIKIIHSGINNSDSTIEKHYFNDSGFLLRKEIINNQQFKTWTFNYDSLNHVIERKIYNNENDIILYDKELNIYNQSNMLVTKISMDSMNKFISSANFIYDEKNRISEKMYILHYPSIVSISKYIYNDSTIKENYYSPRDKLFMIKTGWLNSEGKIVKYTLENLAEPKNSMIELQYNKLGQLSKRIYYKMPLKHVESITDYFYNKDGLINFIKENSKISEFFYDFY